MGYIAWAVIAMGSYGLTGIFLKLALRTIPTEVALVLTNSILVITGLVLILVRGSSIAVYLRVGSPLLYVMLAGLTLSTGIASYYTALSRGPVSIVVPIFAMSFAVASALALVFLGEDIRLTKVAGLAMAAGAIVLLAR